MELYRQSILCPCFRGDTPDQKRFFDAVLSGCIPVVMSHYWMKKDGSKDTSYFAPGVSNTKIYPWAKGSFGEEYSNMGIDYSKLVIEINESNCGELDCLPAFLEHWLNDKDALREKQEHLAKYARLFSYGLEGNAFQYVDAMSALSVRVRHYVRHQAT